MTTRSAIALAAATAILILPALGSAQQPQPQPPTGPAPQAPAEGQEPVAPEQQPPPATSATETQCADQRDDDADGLADCADADCFEAEVCHAGGQPEESDAACSDFVDNDGDAQVDCDDQDCARDGITVCQGSWRAQQQQEVRATDAVPELESDQTIEDLIGSHGDNDGERNDVLCSDGIDNDLDGRTDCQDFGCRFDAAVRVCSDSPGLRFSVVAAVGASYDLEHEEDVTGFDVRFTRIQARALGPIPYLEDSFFLLNMRLERTPRVTFVMFQVPLDHAGHYINLNSGSGGLSSGLIISAAKNPLLEPPFYLFNAFEQGNGASLEVGGPIDAANLLRFRAFAAGGSGEFNGNVGGRFFRTDDRNFSYAGGAQLQLNAIGYFDRFDSPYLYTPSPLTLGFLLGAKYDQRPRERYPAGNAAVHFRYSHFLVRAEAYSKYVLDYGGSFAIAWNAQASILLWPQTFMLAADVGSFFQDDFPETVEFDATLRRPIDQFVWRAALHWYFYRNIGVLSLLFRDAYLEENVDRPEDPTRERELRLEAQFRF